MNTTEKQWINVTGIKRANENAGQSWFSEENKRFFNSMWGDQVYKGKYFITSEQFDCNSPRRYTIRIARPNAIIDTIGEFQQFGSYTAARKYIEEHLD